MTTDVHFKIGERSIVQIGRNFSQWFLSMDLKPSVEPLYSKDIDMYMTSEQILKDLKPSEMSLGDIVRVLDDPQRLINNSRLNAFFIRDASGELRIVDVYWLMTGWCVCSRTIENTQRCIVGRVFSNKPLAA